MAPAERHTPRSPDHRRKPMIESKSSASAHHRDPDDPDERGHGCLGCYRGVVYIGHVVEDRETGQEVEVFEPIPCRRCNDV